MHVPNRETDGAEERLIVLLGSVLSGDWSKKWGWTFKPPCWCFCLRAVSAGGLFSHVVLDASTAEVKS